jgi:hypothetical protein
LDQEENLGFRARATLTDMLQYLLTMLQEFTVDFSFLDHRMGHRTLLAASVKVGESYAPQQFVTQSPTQILAPESAEAAAPSCCSNHS